MVGLKVRRTHYFWQSEWQIFGRAGKVEMWTEQGHITGSCRNARGERHIQAKPPMAGQE